MFSERASNPVIHNRAGWNPFGDSTDLYSTKAGHRIFFIQQQKRGGEEIAFTCAEPSPDAAEAVATAMSDAFIFRIQNPNKSIDIETQNQYTHSLNTQLAPLVNRTQGLQLYRNAVSDLCIDYMNGLYADPNTTYFEYDEKGKAIQISYVNKYLNEKRHRFDEAVKLIKDEISYMQKTASPTPINSGESPQQSDGKDNQILVIASAAPSIVEVTENNHTAKVKLKISKLASDEAKISVIGASIVIDNDNKILFEDDKLSVSKGSFSINHDGSVELPLKDLSVGRNIKITVTPISNGSLVGRLQEINIQVNYKK